MKTPSDDLLLLVNSLNKAERTYFRNSCSATARRSVPPHLQLFNLLCKGGEYNENALIRETGLSGKKQFATLKIRLKSQLLRSLNSYHSQLDKQIELQELILSAKIMVKKSLLDLAFKLIQKAKKLATEYEYYDYSLIISSIETVIVRMQSDKVQSMNEYLNTELPHRRHVIELLRNTFEYQKLWGKAHMITVLRTSAREDADKEALEEILGHPLLTSEKKASTFYSLRNFYYLHFTCNYHLNKISEASLGLQRQWIEQLEKDSDKLIDRKIIYLDELCRLTAGAGPEEAEQALQKALAFVNSLPASRRSKNAYALLSVIAANVISSLLSMDYHAERALEIWKQYNTLTSSFRTTNPRTRILIDIELCFACMLLGNYQQGLVHASNVMNIRQKTWVSLQQTARIFGLILLYELKRHEQLGPAAKEATKYFIKTDGAITEYDSLLLNYFGNKLPGQKENDGERLLKQWKEELAKVPEKSVLYLDGKSLFNFKDWIESKILGIPFSVHLKGKAQPGK